ncbi:hypothetical protein ACFPJ4_08305 [Lysinimonas soli]|uniref:ABC transporter ATP-binding protein n=1 Tax=Lysinimonas soli TaxID=1074233 RepID=A0ABW0NTM8_9MICO
MNDKQATPNRRDRTRPVELIVLAAVFGVFSGLVVGLATREWILAAIFFGVVFIVSLVVLAMLVLAASPAPPEDEQHDPDAGPEARRGH